MARGQPEGEAVYRPEVMPEVMPRKITPEERGAGELGGALERAAAPFEQAVVAKQQADASNQAGLALSQFRLQQAAKLAQMKGAVQAGDPGDFAGKFMEQFDSAADTLGQGLSDHPVARNMAAHAVRGLRDSLAMHAMEWEATQRKAYQNDANQTAFESQLPFVRQQAAAGHPEIADQVGETTSTSINASTNDPAQKLEQMRHVHEQLSLNVGLGLADAHPQDVFEQLKTGNMTTPQLAELRDPVLRAQVLEQATKGMIQDHAQFVVDTYRKLGPAAGQKAFGQVDQLGFAGANDRETLALRDQVRDEVHKGRAALIQEQQQVHGAALLDVEQQLRSGDPDPGTRAKIWGLYQEGALEPHVAGGYLGELTRLEAKQADTIARQRTIADAFDGKVHLDPKDANQKTDMTNWFTATADANHWTPGSQQWINFAAQTAHNSGMIPGPVGVWARSILVGSEDPASVVAAVDAVDRVRNAAPRAWPYFEDDHKLGAMVDAIGGMTRAGTPPPVAIKIARENAARGERDNKILGERWDAAKPFGDAKETALENVFRNQIEGDKDLQARLTTPTLFGFNVPQIPSALAADYESLTHSYYMSNGGDIPSAQRSASRDIAHGPWGITRMNGAPQIQRLAPERMFPGLSSEDIRTDVGRVVDENAKLFQHWDDDARKMVPFKPDPANVVVTPTPETDSSNGLRWGLAYQPQGPGGPTEDLRQPNGHLFSYTLPVDREAYAAVKQRQQAQAEAESKARADQIKSEQAAQMRALDADSQSWLGMVRSMDEGAGVH